MGNDYGQLGGGRRSTSPCSAGTDINGRGLYSFICSKERNHSVFDHFVPFSIGLLAYTRHERYVHQTGFVILLNVSRLLLHYCLYMCSLSFTSSCILYCLVSLYVSLDAAGYVLCLISSFNES